MDVFPRERQSSLVEEIRWRGYGRTPRCANRRGKILHMWNCGFCRDAAAAKRSRIGGGAAVKLRRVEIARLVENSRMRVARRDLFGRVEAGSCILRKPDAGNEKCSEASGMTVP